ncbi:hypothetical protein ONZ45_g13893 [Pleurotus djamor]|nr:hypothetical protein ONZ45_g13893 [Pleurotus djamor]
MPPKKVVDRKPDLSYYLTPPQTKWGTTIWRWRIRLEATFAITVLEPWEKVVVVTFLALVFLLILYGVITFVPKQFLTMQRRAIYYIWGHEADAHRVWSGITLGKDGSS